MKSIYKDFIGIYENAFPKEYCQHLINVGEKNIIQAQKRKSNPFYNEDLYFNLAPYLNEKDIKFFYKTVNNIISNFYIKKYQCLEEVVSQGYNITDFKYQITNPSQGYHVWHPEYDYNASETRLRWGVWTFYLNDVEEGGETEFLYQSLRIKPKQGTLCLFPAYYTHMHRGNPPLRETKHILTGWIEYKPKNN